MKKLVNIALIFSFYLYSYSQTQNAEKIIEALGQERYLFLQKHFPDSIQYYHFVISDGFDIVHQKHADVERLSTATPLKIPADWIKNGVPQKSSINIFKLPVSFNQHSFQYYLIEGTDYVLRTKSLEYINKKFQAKPNK